MYFQSIILHCHQQMQQERSISATFYLLQGKPSIQTIQDGQIYQLNKYFGIYKHLPKQRFFQIVEEFLSEELIQKQTEDNFFEITTRGKKWMEQYTLTPNYLEGALYKNIDMIFFQRMLLFIQVFANSKMNHMKYIPIIENKEVETWIKTNYKKWKSKTDVILETLYGELIQLLSTIEDSVAEIFVNQLTGYKRIGLTMEQIAEALKMSLESVHVIHVNTIHYMLKTIQSEHREYPLLYEICHDLFQQSSLTKSTKVTAKLMNAGYSITDIAEKRQLQLNTVYDHVVEVAVKERNFSISDFVPEQAQKDILQAIHTLHSYKLKDIKNMINEEISYFQIRLVIAKLDEYK